MRRSSGVSILCCALCLVCLPGLPAQAESLPEPIVPDEVREHLKDRVSVSFAGTPLATVLQFMQHVTPLEYTLYEEDLPAGGAPVSLMVETTVEHCIGLLCELTDLSWTVEEGGIAIGKPGSLKARPMKASVPPVPPELRQQLGAQVALAFDGVPMPQVVEFLRQVTQAQFVLFERDVPPGSAAIRMEFEGTLEEAVHRICRQTGLGWQLEGPVIKIGKPERLSLPDDSHSVIRPRTARARFLAHSFGVSDIPFEGSLGFALRQADDEVLASLERFLAACRLGPGENFRLIWPPYMPERQVYYEWHDRHQAEAIPRGPDRMTFHWEEPELRPWGMAFGRCTLGSVLRSVTGLGRQDIEGSQELLRRPLRADSVHRPGVPMEQLVEDIEAVLCEQLNWPARLTFRNVQRTVVVVSGEYRLNPLPPYADRERDTIEIYGNERREDPRTGAGGSGDFDEFLHWVGGYVGRTVIAEALPGAPERLSWYEGPRLRDAAGAIVRPLPYDETQLVLQHLTEQTGLRFREEEREVRVLFVELEPPEAW